MFEKSLETPAQRAWQPDESLSGEQVAGRKVAGIILVVNVFLSLATSALAKAPLPIWSAILQLILARLLYRRIRGATGTALVVVIALGLWTMFLAVRQGPTMVILLEAASVGGTVLALLLLLSGHPSRARRIAGIAAFVLMTVPVYAFTLWRVIPRLS